MSIQLQTILGILFPFLMTTLGATTVFLFGRNMSKQVQSVFLGFAAGVMIAASIFSLLLPAIEMVEEQSGKGWLVASVGFLIGAAFLTFLDKLLPHMHLNSEESEGLPSSLNKSTLLLLAVTMHNIPEGMAVGLVFASALYSGEATALLAAFALAIGMGIQNFPEGAAVALPLKSTGLSTKKSFLLGSLSGIVEPIFAFVTLFLFHYISGLLPFLLSFSAGAMMFVTVEELIPEAQSDTHSHNATYGILAGFVVMMIFDVALG